MLSRLFGSTPSGGGISELPAPTNAPLRPMQTASPTTIAIAFFNPGLMLGIVACVAPVDTEGSRAGLRSLVSSRASGHGTEVRKHDLAVGFREHSVAREIGQRRRGETDHRRRLRDVDRIDDTVEIEIAVEVLRRL